MTRRYYSNTAILSYITSALNGVDTTSTFSVSATSGGATAPPTDWPAVPFYAAISRGAADEEVVLVTDVTGSSVTVTRGSTLASPYGSTTQAHSINATIEHVASAADYDESNAHIEATTGHGATGAVVGTTNTQTLTNKTLTAPVLTAPVIVDFTSAAHDHGDADDGGTISHAVLTDLTTGDPHTQYQKESEKSAANGYASLDASTLVPIAELPTGTGASEVALGNHSHAHTAQDYALEDSDELLTSQTLGTDDLVKTLATISVAAGKYILIASCAGYTLNSGSSTRVAFQLSATVGTLYSKKIFTQSDGTALQGGASVVGYLDASGTSSVTFEAYRVAGVAADTSTNGQLLAIKIA